MRKAILVLLLTMALIGFANASTMTVTDVNYRCSPTNQIQGNACYSTSTFTIDFKVTDDNSATTLQSDWNYQICYDLGAGSADCWAGDSVMIDGNLMTICNSDVLGNDNNFQLGRNCSTTFTTTALSNGTWDFNIMTQSNFLGTPGIVSQGSANKTIAVNNQNVTNTTLSVIILLVVALAGFTVFKVWREGAMDPMIGVIALITIVIIIAMIVLIMG